MKAWWASRSSWAARPRRAGPRFDRLLVAGAVDEGGLLLGGLDLLQAAGAQHPMPRWRATVRWRRIACLGLGRARDAVDQEHRDELARFGCARAGFVLPVLVPERLDQAVDAARAPSGGEGRAGGEPKAPPGDLPFLPPPAADSVGHLVVNGECLDA